MRVRGTAVRFAGGCFPGAPGYVAGRAWAVSVVPAGGYVGLDCGGGAVTAPAADCRHTAWPGVNSCRDCGLSGEWRTFGPDADACPGCRADRGEPCREWCLSTVTDADGQPVEDGE